MLVNSGEASYWSDKPPSSSVNHSTVSNKSDSSQGDATKAKFTVHLPSFQILLVNAAACQLMKYNVDELCLMNLEDLITDSYKHKLSKLYEKFLNCDGKIPSFSEKLLELVRKDEKIILGSVCLKKLDNPDRCLVLIKVIERRTGSVCVDKNGKILSFDEGVALIFDYDPSELLGLNISSLLPSLNILKEKKNQCKGLRSQITGRTRNQSVFPVSLKITCENPSLEEYNIVISVVNSLNGLISLNKKLLITNCNSYFTKLLFGFSKKKILNMPIWNLIPTFCTDIGFEQSKNFHWRSLTLKKTNLSRSSSENESNHNSSENLMDECLQSSSSMSFTHVSDSSKPNECSSKTCDNNFDRDTELNTFIMQLSASSIIEDQGTQAKKNISSDEKLGCCSQTNKKIKNNCADKNNKSFISCSENVMVQEGKFLGLAQHRDGNYISIKYEVKITPVNDENFYCVWLSRDWPKISDLSKTIFPKTVPCFDSNSVDGSLERDSPCSDEWTRPSTASLVSQCDENLTAGDYSKFYTNIRQIGKGAFGYVKMAYRNSDGLLVVTKFTKKQNTNLVSWVFHSNLNLKIPLEIGLLTTLHHPNIVKVLDVFHNDSFVQLVMEKHGAGFDLFEFINRRPKCDEKLKSYIYRQIISAVHYLNSLGILHRDIKDENVIINEKFEIKLIDFGSATFMPRNETFSKFYGTVEYCSPEVLQGSSYKGPELEIWALGVTLYVLTFGENPFYNVEETIQGQFSIPFPISEDLDNLLHNMLDKNVETRITIDKVVKHPWINQPVAIEKYKFEEVVRCSKEEAYPPKYVQEINSEEFLPKNSRTFSYNMENTSNNSNDSLSNLSEIDDFEDNFQEIPKPPVSESAGSAGSKFSPNVFSSPTVQTRSDRLRKSSASAPNRYKMFSSLSERSYKWQNNSLVEDRLSLKDDYSRNFKSDTSSDESDSFEENSIF